MTIWSDFCRGYQICTVTFKILLVHHKNYVLLSVKMESMYILCLYSLIHKYQNTERFFQSQYSNERNSV